MRKLVIDTLDALESYRAYEPMIFDFYPHGFTGLVADLIRHHYHHLTATNRAKHEQDFIDEIMGLYHESPQYYQFYENDPQGLSHESTIMTACISVSEHMREFVVEHQKELGKYKLDSGSVQLGLELEYVLLERI